MAPKKSTKGKPEVATSSQSQARKVTETSQAPKDETVPEQPKPRAANSSKATKHDSNQSEATQPKIGQKVPVEKRKRPVEPDQPEKTPRRSTRSAPKSQPSQQQLLRYMLSTHAEALCRPDDEVEDLKSRGDVRTYSSTALSPFEELMCAVILSRPISHRLGLRSIRTVLNDPYNFTTPKAIQAAGSEKRHQALWDAKTQHKAKTADQLGQIADIVLDKFTSADDKDGSRLQKALDDSNNDIDKTLARLKDEIKGLGSTGLDIFLRRVQWIWDVAYPYVDDRSSQSLKKIGLPSDAEALEKLLNEHWSKLETKHLAGKDDEAKKRRAFVTVLERATGAGLEGKVDALMDAAAQTA